MLYKTKNQAGTTVPSLGVLFELYIKGFETEKQAGKTVLSLAVLLKRNFDPHPKRDLDQVCPSQEHGPEVFFSKRPIPGCTSRKYQYVWLSRSTRNKVNKDHR